MNPVLGLFLIVIVVAGWRAYYNIQDLNNGAADATGYDFSKYE